MTTTTDNAGLIRDTDIFPRTVRAVFSLTRKQFMTPRLSAADGDENWALLADLLERFGPGKRDLVDVANGGTLGMLALLRPKEVREQGDGLLQRMIELGADPWVDIRKGRESWRTGASGPVALRIIESGDMRAALACLRHPLFPGWQALGATHIRMLVEDADAQQILTLVDLGGMNTMAKWVPGHSWSQTATLTIRGPKVLDAWLSLVCRKGMIDKVLPGEHASSIADAMHGSGRREQVMRRHCMEQIQAPGMDKVVAHMAVAALKRGDRRNYKAWCAVGRGSPLVASMVFQNLGSASAAGLRDTVKMAHRGTINHTQEDIGVMLWASFAMGTKMLSGGHKMLWPEHDDSGRWLLDQARKIIENQDIEGLAAIVKQEGPHIPKSTALLGLALLGRAGFAVGFKGLSCDANEARGRVDRLLAKDTGQIARLMAIHGASGIEQTMETEFNNILPQSLMKPLTDSNALPGNIRMAVMQLRCAGKLCKFEAALTRSWDEIIKSIDGSVAANMDKATAENARQIQNWRINMEQSLLNKHVDATPGRGRSGPRF